MRAIVHIGIEKTGTTSIQKALVRNRAALWTSGIHYSELCSESGRHDFLPYVAAKAELASQMHDVISLFGDGAEAKIHEALSRELEQTSCDKILFSTEHCHRALFSIDCVARLHDFLRRYFDDIEVVAYLRRQDRVAISAYSTHLRFGGTGSEPFGSYERGILEYDHMLHRWSSVFGERNMRGHIYEDAVYGGTSIVTHFVNALGIGDFADDCQENVRLSPAEQTLMSLVNNLMGPYNGNTIRSAISNVSTHMRYNTHSIVSRADARAYMQHFEQSNEDVRGAYFPDKTSLFDDDYSDYLEEASAGQRDDLIALAVNSLAEGGRIISDLEHEIRVLRDART